ncbi:hypothetical protein AFNJKBDN_CDS0061 [Halorubrum virus V_ICIS4]|nr:hypothetical protein AFNJKBDN_CDS0061 [Halorubrum virus V_ICIS4]
MSKEPLSLRIPEHIVDDIDEVKAEQGMSDRSQAAREVIRRGLEYEPAEEPAGPTPGERLLETATGVAGVAALGAAVVQPALAPVFGLTAFVLAILWAGVMVYAGRDLV